MSECVGILNHLGTVIFSHEYKYIENGGALRQLCVHKTRLESHTTMHLATDLHLSMMFM